MNRIARLLLGLAMTASLQAQTPVGGPILAKLTVETEKVDETRTKTGSFRNSFEATLTAELKNTSKKEALKPVHLRLIPFFISATQEITTKGYQSDTIQTKDYLSLGAGDIRYVRFDPIYFEWGEKTTAEPGSPGGSKESIPYGGKYVGAALEICLGSRLISVQFQNPTQVRAAYEKWAEIEAKAQPSTTPPALAP